MEKLLLDLENEIINSIKNTKIAKELYELLSSYTAYSILHSKAKQEYENKEANINHYYSACYETQIDDLFTLFKNDECLKGKIISGTNDKDWLFLIDEDTLLRLNSFKIMNSNIAGLANINYQFLKINNCTAKIYKENIYCYDPYYCDSHYEVKDAFGLFYKNNLITPSYILEDQFRNYDNMDIREILKVQSLDDIHEKIHEAKNRKTKKLILTK